jgi:hypothetical protein
LRLSGAGGNGAIGMMRLVLAIVALLGAAQLAWAEEPRQRVMNIPLDMPLEHELDGEYLEGIYQEKLLPELKDSVLIETPIQHIESSFTQNRKLELWFSSREDGRRVFWAHLTQGFAEGQRPTPEIAMANFEAVFGKPDLLRESKGDIGGSWIALKLDPRLSDERRAATLRQLEASFKPTADQIGGFVFLDMRDRVRLLGPDFRGAIFSFSAFKGKVGAQQTELLDMVRAHSVLNLTP